MVAVTMSLVVSGTADASTMVTPTRDGYIWDSPSWGAGTPNGVVYKGHRYKANCWQHGQLVGKNDIWVALYGEDGDWGMWPAWYLTGGATGGVPTKCSV
jgi:hypothetical protein